jgi:hypothetical protein
MEVAQQDPLDILSAIHNEIQNKAPLRAIDLALSHLGTGSPEKNEKRCLRLLLKAALAAQGRPISDTDDVYDIIFHPELGPGERRFVAVCLARALSGAPNLFLEPALRNRTFLLLDAALPDIYKELKIDARRQTHEKEAALAAYVRGAEHDFEELLSSIDRPNDGRWESITQARAELQRLLRKYGPLVNHFLSKSLTGAPLESLFSVVKDYLNADESTSLHAYDHATAALRAYSAEAAALGTTYARLICERLSAVLTSICENKFELSGAGKEARITARASEKRYPLSSPQRQVNLSFTIENEGPGYGHDLTCRISCDGTADPLRNELYLGSLGVGRIAVEFPVTILRAANSMFTEFSWQWTNFDGSQESRSSLFEVHGQPTGIDWDTLSMIEPYKLEPVTTQEELVGRDDILSQLAAKAYTESVGSACIWGQRRVGKTSIAKTLMTRISAKIPRDIVVLFLESGDYIHPDANKTIQLLGTKICRQIAAKDKRFQYVTKPSFEGALSPLSDFVDDIFAIAPELRFIIILDEFDTVPLDLYRRGAAGEAFFATIRSLSHKPNIGFVLVGGERMRYLFDCQGQALNKFQMIRVDYFDRSRHWNDFQDLVSRPAKKYLQFGDSALVRLYAEAAGNPYYTVLICRKLFTLMVARRDSYITEKEAEEAVALTIEDAPTVHFQHFWDDGIVETGVVCEEISMRRRYVLLALAEAMGQRLSAPRSKVAEAAKIYGLDTRAVQNEISEFVQRDVLIEDNGEIRCKVPLFARWLRTVGPRQISTTYTEAEAQRIHRQQEESVAVRSPEIVQLLEKWPPYKGMSLSPDHLRTWLEQFGRKSHQRLMFRILKDVRFYSENEIRNKMEVVHGIVTRGMVDRRIHKQVKKWPGVLVSYLDGPGKSGARFAKLYVDENEMYSENLIEKSQLKEVLSKREDLDGLVFIDDFIGTGRSICDYLENFIATCWSLVKQRRLRVFVISVCGFESGKKAIEGFLNAKAVPIRVHICDLFDESDKCFSPSSKVFPEPEDRNRAMEIAEQKGLQLCKPAPLGYGNSQALVVFSHNCPNNSLPILWEKTRDWMPLFRRD